MAISSRLSHAGRVLILGIALGFCAHRLVGDARASTVECSNPQYAYKFREFELVSGNGDVATERDRWPFYAFVYTAQNSISFSNDASDNGESVFYLDLERATSR
jgi:hypothetical protein